MNPPLTVIKMVHINLFVLCKFVIQLSYMYANKSYLVVLTPSDSSSGGPGPLWIKSGPSGGEGRERWPPRLKLGSTNTIFLAPALLTPQIQNRGKYTECGCMWRPLYQDNSDTNRTNRLWWHKPKHAITVWTV